MRNKRLIILLVFVAFSCILLVPKIALASPKSSEQLIKDIATFDDSIRIVDYETVYSKINHLLSMDNHNELISQYYNSLLGRESVDDAYSYLYAQYDAALIHTKKYDELEISLKTKKEYTKTELNNYFKYLWWFCIAFSSDDNMVEYDKVIETITNNSFYDTDIEKSKEVFLYYFHIYFEINIPDNLINIRNESTYSNNRTQYVLILLSAEKYEDFKRMFIKEYINTPFTGYDIVLLIQSPEILSELQLEELNDSLEQLKLVYEDNDNILKVEIIKNLQDMIEEKTGDGSDKTDKTLRQGTVPCLRV